MKRHFLFVAKPPLRVTEVTASREGVSVMDYKEQAKTTIRDFLEAWKAKDTDKMFSLSQITWKSGKASTALDSLAQETTIKKFNIVGCKSFSEVMVDCFVEVDGCEAVAVRLIKESAPYKTDKDGVWGVNPISALKIVGVKYAK